jgi:hypothetical protein
LDNLEEIAEAKVNVYRQIHQICFHGKGGYSWPVVYNMPLYLRRFIYNEIKTFYEEENKAAKTPKSPNQKIIHPGISNNTPKPNPKKPSPQPSKSVRYK